METSYRLFLVLHVIGGTVGLLSMLFPLVAKKGARLHRLTGWVFTLGMALSAVTGIAMAAAWILMPQVFQPSSTVLEARVDGVFLALIGALTGNALIQAVTAVRRKKPAARGGLVPRASIAVLVMIALASIALGVAYGAKLSLLFGVGSLVSALADLRFTMRPLTSPMAWWYQHMNAMSTACISAITAFLVLGARRWLGSDVLGDRVWMLWVAPTLVIAPLFQIWIVRYQRKLEPRKRAQKAQEATA